MTTGLQCEGKKDLLFSAGDMCLAACRSEQYCGFFSIDIFFPVGTDNLPLFVEIDEKSQYIEALVWVLRDRIWHRTKSDIFILNPDNEVSFDDIVSALKREDLPWSPKDVLTKPREKSQGE